MRIRVHVIVLAREASSWSQLGTILFLHVEKRMVAALADRLRESTRMTHRIQQSAAILASTGRCVAGARRGAVLISCLVAVGGARAGDDWMATSEGFLCKSNTEVREVKSYSNSEGTDLATARGCRVDYIKNGSTQTIWSSRTSVSFCDGKASQLAAKLEASHFSCSPLRLQRSGEG